jgi:hypothetical protein
VCEFENQPQNKSSQAFRKWFWHHKRMLNLKKKLSKHFLIMALKKKNAFCDKKCAVFGSKITLWLKMRAKGNFQPKTAIFCHKNAFFEKAIIKECLNHFRIVWDDLFCG